MDEAVALDGDLARDSFLRLGDLGVDPAQGASGSVGAVAVVDGLVAALVASSGGPGPGRGQPVGDVLVGVVVVPGADHVGDA